MLDNRITLALEQLMLHPQYRELAEAIRAGMPTALTDQHDAATRDTTHVYAAIAEQLGGSVNGRTVAETPAWIRLGVIEAWVGYCSGRAATCIHAPSAERPTPVFAAAWKPGLVVCGQCIRLTSPRAGSLKDRTCDGCGHECAGVDAGDPIYPSGAQMGSLIFQFGVCTSCRDDAEALPVPSRKATR